MRLNGWQRLWVVFSILWTLVLAMVAWSDRPAREGDTVSVFWSAGSTGDSPGTLSQVDYYDVLAQLARWSDWNGGPEPTWTGAPMGFVPDAASGPLVTIPLVGSVRFPQSMSGDQLSAAAKDVYDRHQKVIEKVNRLRGEAFYASRRSWLQETAALWLIPPIALYALGFSAKWVYRGFTREGA